MICKYDAVALGECLIDFFTQPSVAADKVSLDGAPGGAPANVMAGLAKLGMRSAFIGKVGDDYFGKFLTDNLAAAGIDCSALIHSVQYPTTLAMVSLAANGERNFSFYRDRTADVMLEADEIDENLLKSTRLFHFGSVSLTAEPSRSATLSAKADAKRFGARISCDVNYRAPLWRDEAEARRVILESLGGVDFLKLSEEELEFLTGCKTIESGVAALCKERSYSLLAVTMGEKGCVCARGSALLSVKAHKVSCIDSTGAGDAFWAALLFGVLENGGKPEELSSEKLYEIADFANAAGALATTKKGAIPALPTLDEVNALMRK